MESPNTPSTLTEHVADWHAGLSVDRTNRTVRNVALTGTDSRNGYRYTEQALRSAADLYQGKPVFLDHAIDKSRPHERSTRDLVGTIVNSRFESGRIRGDIHVLDTDSGKTFLALTESDAPGVGMSHVVLAQRAAADGVVDRIHDVVSVDAVVFPATTRTFRESLADSADSVDLDGEESDPNKSSDSAIDRPAEAVRPTETEAQTQDPRLRERLQQLICERDELVSQLQRVREREEAQAREATLDRQLQTSGLPGYALSGEFRQQLLLADERTRSALLADRLLLIDAAARQHPSSHERSNSTRLVDSDQAFLATIKRSKA